VNLAMKHGPDAMAAAFATLMNHARQIERKQVLRAEPCISAHAAVLESTP
jgi:hypothetical protein